MGFSGGAAVSTHVASRDQRVKGVVLCACPAQFHPASDKAIWQSSLEHFRNIGIVKDGVSMDEWVGGFQEIRPDRWISGISPRPVLIMHGTADEVVPVQHAEILHRNAGEPRQLMVLDGAGHRLRREEKAMDMAIKWLVSRSS